MSITLTANFTEILQIPTIKVINELVEDNYELTDILEFIDENSEEDFVNFYVDYCEQGENLGYDVVDAFVKEYGFEDVAKCEDAYVGRYESGADFAEQLAEEQGADIPEWLSIDWEDTFDRNLSYDYDCVEISYRDCVIFSRYY